MYYVSITKTFNGRSEEVEYSFPGSIEAGDLAEKTIGRMVTTYPGEWEIESGQVGHPEANHYRYTGAMGSPDAPDGLNEVSFEIHTWG